MKTRSLQSKLTIFYAVTIIVPVLIFSFVLPFYYQNVIQNETQSLTENTLTAVTRNIETYLDDLEKLTEVPYFNDNLMEALDLKASPLYKDKDLATKMFVERTLSLSLQPYFQNLRKDIVGTTLLTMDNSVYVENSGLSSSIPNFPYAKQEWYKKTIEMDGKAAFISTHKQNYLTTPAAKYVFSVARLIKDPETLEPLAIIMADADTGVLNDIFNDLDFNIKSYGAIMNEDNELFYSNSHIPKEMLQQLKEGKTTIKGESDNFVLVTKMVQPANWKIVVLLSKKELNQKVKWMYITGILYAIGGLVLTYLLFFILSRWIVKPFKSLTNVMTKVEEGNLDIRASTNGNDEISKLSTSFNTMLDKLNDLIDREYRAVLNQRNAEFKALQSQIHPHFLFNTLNGFVALNRMGDQKTLENAIISLSRMLRYSLNQEDWTTIKEGFQFLKSYCSLQQMRFEDRLQVFCDYDAMTADYLIPKLILQPFVENAIIHGCEPSPNPCTLAISSKIINDQNEAFLELSVVDDGIGFDSGQEFTSKSIGITNVRERLKMLYPASTLQITSCYQKGTSVIIKIPERDVKK